MKALGTVLAVFGVILMGLSPLHPIIDPYPYVAPLVAELTGEPQSPSINFVLVGIITGAALTLIGLGLYSSAAKNDAPVVYKEGTEDRRLIGRIILAAGIMIHPVSNFLFKLDFRATIGVLIVAAFVIAVGYTIQRSARVT